MGAPLRMAGGPPRHQSQSHYQSKGHALLALHESPLTSMPFVVKKQQQPVGGSRLPRVGSAPARQGIGSNIGVIQRPGRAALYEM